MVAIKSAEADRFLGQLPQHLFLYLVFGTDAGLVSERKRAIIKCSVSDPTDAFQLVQLAGDEIAADPLLLLDEANSISLFGGKRAISVYIAGKNFVPALEMLLKAPPQDCTIILEGGALKRDSPYRRLIEPSRNAATIECYPDGPREISDMISKTVAAAHIRITPEAVSALSQLLGADRMSTRAELDKLLLFAYGQEAIGLEDVEAIVADASALAIDSAVNGAFSGNISVVDDVVSRIFANGSDGYLLLSAALRHSIALQRARLDIDSGGSLDQAALTITRSGSFLRRDLLDMQLRIWGHPRLKRVIKDLSETVGKSRRDAKIADALTLRALWSITRIAQKARR